MDKGRDVVGLYLDPPEKAIVLCVDEKSQIQAIDRTAPIAGHADHTSTDDPRLRPPRHHRPVRCLRPDQRRGHRQPPPAAPHQEFLRFLELIDTSVPAEYDRHLILDSYATHKTPALKRWLLRHPRFHLHFTPTSASWLNLVERWVAELTSRRLRRSTHRFVTELEADIRRWINAWNADPKPFMWTKTADETLNTLAAYCQRINDSGH